MKHFVDRDSAMLIADLRNHGKNKTHRYLVGRTGFPMKIHVTFAVFDLILWTST